jgi:hypothetical protein
MIFMFVFFVAFVAMGDLRKLAAMNVDVLENRQPDLTLIVRALRTPRRRPRSLHCRQQKRDQDANDGDDD